MIVRKIECVGPWFLKYFTQGDKFHDSGDDEDESTEPEPTFTVEVDLTYLKSLDPKEWKDHDHYKILGVPDKRWQVTDADIKYAYRQMVLKHHPDKRKAQGEVVNRDDDYFTCITKAYEILGEKVKRRAFDSVDPEFDNSIPSSNENAKKNFFKVFTPVFERNARWSEKKKMPPLGTIESTREEVEHFYDCWYNFESWREYSYLDEEDKDKGQDREERRYIDKCNKDSRKKLKKEEMTRIRSLVDTAYNIDPRIIKFKQEDKEAKLAVKKARQDAIRAHQEQIRKQEVEALRKEREEKEKQEAEEKARQEILKAEKESMKKIMKKERKNIRDVCKANNYFISSDKDLVKHMSSVESICELYSADELRTLFKKLQSKNAKAEFCNEISKLKQNENDKSSASNTPVNNSKHMNGTTSKSNTVDNGHNHVNNDNEEWSSEELQMLIKAVNVFPAGTNQRWDVVANFITQHVPNSDKSAKQVLAKAKELQNNDFSKSSLKEEANAKAFDNFEKEKKNIQKVDAVTSERLDDKPWTKFEQELLEQGLKTYPSSLGAERWEKIASHLPNRTKKDCMKRFKELVELVKSKKAGSTTKSQNS
uniref:DnaJ homolog subfamily C member 2 n=1 Tax=Cacopsylla melanoneura TaxID=428564 RepID=A0A8D8Q2A3_9HEMI